jgi:ferric-dicitrate binding protein FerR (iron transport regulator)
LGEASSEEIERVEAWKKANPANQKEFEKLATIWVESKKISRQSSVDADAAWEKFKQLRDQQDRGALPAKVVPLFPTRNRVISIAAAVVIILGIGLLFRMMGKQEPVPVQVAMINLQSGLQILTDTLPDGTIVTLNKNSRVNYPEVFSDTNRLVNMEGEVFFDVAKNPAKPFIIQTGTADIKVLGTSFNIKSRQGRTEVIVETGRVEVAYNQKKVELTPGKMVTVHEGDSVLQTENSSNMLHQYFRNKRFICDNTPLSELAVILSEAYGVNIVFEKQAIGNMKITTTFSDESLENIVNIIEETMGVTATRQGDVIVIRQ